MPPARTVLITALVAFALFFPGPHRHRTQAKRETLVFASPKTGWPPFIITTKNASCCRGIMPDVLTEICTALEYDMAVEYYPEKRCQMLLAEGRIDVFPKSPKWVDDPSAFLWTEPVLNVSDVIVYPRESPVRFSTPHDLEGLNIGTIHGFIYPTLTPFFERDIIHRHNTFSTRSLMYMLVRGHVDGVVTSRQVAKWIIKEEADLTAEQFGCSETAVDSAPYGFAFARGKGWEPFIETFNRELKAMRRDGRLEAILNRYR